MMFKPKQSVWLILLLMCWLTPVLAKNLGVWGNVYPIGEQDFRIFILRRLRHLEKTGAYQTMQHAFIKRVKQHVFRPTPVAGLTTTTHPKTFFYTPRFVVTHNIADPLGHLIAKKGEVIKPLNLVSLHAVLVFFNADDKRQLAFARAQANHYRNIKYILVKGNIKTSTKALESRVYFDQDGRITHQLGVSHIPTLVKQTGKQLQLTEIDISRWRQIHQKPLHAQGGKDVD